MEGLQDSLEGSEACIFPNRAEVVQGAVCRWEAAEAVCPHSCLVCSGAPPPHTMLMYMFCAGRAKRLQSPDKCAPAVSHCATL